MAPRIEDVVGHARLQGLQFVMLALPMGVVLLGGVVVFMHAMGNGSDAPDDPRVKYMETISWVNGAVGVAAIFAAGILFRLRLGGTLDRPQDVTRWFQQRVVGAYLIRAAVLEGSALFGLLAVMLAVQGGHTRDDPIWLVNAVTALPIVVITLTRFPSAERLQMLLEDRT